MNDILKELQRKERQLSSELKSVYDEIEKIERELLNSNTESYKGKWFFCEDSWWDEYDYEFEHYNIVYVEDIRFQHGEPRLSVVKFEFDYYHSLRNIKIERDECYSIDHLKQMKGMTDYDFSQMDDILTLLLELLFKIRPSLTSEIE